MILVSQDIEPVVDRNGVTIVVLLAVLLVVLLVVLMVILLVVLLIALLAVVIVVLLVGRGCLLLHFLAHFTDMLMLWGIIVIW